MRITNGMLVNNMIRHMANNQERMMKLEDKMATGKKINLASDDPLVAARALKLRTTVAEAQQYQTNVTDATSWLELTDSTLGNMGDLIQRARELAVNMSNSTYTVNETQKVESEVSQLRQQMAHLGNATYSGRYIFSGYSTDKPFIDEVTGQYNIDVVGNGANTENIRYQIGVGDDMIVNIKGGEAFDLGNDAVTGAKGSMIQSFDDLISGLNTDNKSLIMKSIADFDVQMENLLKVRADVGARSNRLELTSYRLDTDNLNFTKLMSENEDVDMAETIMKLQSEENVYKASLSGGAKIIQPTLMDFLR